jgi:hypothetical protein
MPKLNDDLLAAARQIDLIHYLRGLGYQPVYVKANKALFHSPLREDQHPSFTVHYTDGAWKWIDWARDDHGDGIDLVRSLKGMDFQAAVRDLLGAASSSSPTPRDLTAPSLTPHSVRRMYTRWQEAMTPERTFLIHQYFLQHNMAFPQELGIVYLDITVNADGLKLPFLGIPAPSAHPRSMTTLECRALDPQRIPRQHRRRTFGPKSLWVIRRPSSGLLVTESIIDCLAGNQLVQHQLSLCALNSINLIDQLLPCMRQLRPKTVYLALDHDERNQKHGQTPGQTAQHKACRTLVAAGYRVVEVAHHARAGVKDLHKLLLKDPSPITLQQLEQHGTIHTPASQRA